MKALLVFLMYLVYNVSFGQILSDTIIVIENDSILVHRDIPSKEIKFMGSIASYVNKNIPRSVLKYTRRNNFKGRIFFKVLVNINGKTKVMGVENILDSYLESKCYPMFKSMEWEPALDKEGNPVNRMIMIPLSF